jgi:TatD DNase family protein
LKTQRKHKILNGGVVVAVWYNEKDMTPLFDSHCHLHDPRLDGVRDDVVARAVRAGIVGCRTCGTGPDDWDAVATLESRPDFEIRKAFGVHPWYAENLPADWLDRLRAFLANDSDAWIGEIGLDAIRTPAPTGISRTVLRSQLELAAELGRPVILHGAKAFDELLAACRPFVGKIPSFTVHAFGGSEVQLRRWLEIGAFISIGGAVTQSKRLRRLIFEIPPERLCIETDAPDMLPIGGEPAIPGTKLNQPSNLVLVARAISYPTVKN